MDKLVGHMAKQLTYMGEKKAPIKSLKIKVKFDTGSKGAKSKALKNAKTKTFADKWT